MLQRAPRMPCGPRLRSTVTPDHHREPATHLSYPTTHPSSPTTIGDLLPHIRHPRPPSRTRNPSVIPDHTPVIPDHDRGPATTHPSPPTTIANPQPIRHPRRPFPVIPGPPQMSFVCCKCPTNRPICGAGGRGASTVIGRTGLLAWSCRVGVRHPSRQSDTPNRYRGRGPAFASGEADNAMIRIRSTRW